MTPTFSVQIPLYNHAATVGDAVRSALEQTAPPHEVIVCDDGSTDEPGPALAPFRDRITVLRQRNQGAAAANNAALAEATGDFIAILDPDDVWEPRRLERLGELADERPELDILGADAWFERDGQVVGRFLEANPFPQEAQDLAIVRSCFLWNPAMRRGRVLAVGAFDRSLPIAYDWDILLRLILADGQAGIVDEPLARYRLHAGSLTAERVRSLRDRVSCLEKVVWRLDLDARLQEAVRQSLARHRRRAARAALAASPLKARSALGRKVRHATAAAPTRNRLARRVDWRFLVGAVEPRQVFCLAGEDMRAALEAVGASVVEEAERDSCDLAVLSNPHRRDLERAFEVLEPGGPLYAEWTHPPSGIHRVTSRLEHAGFGDVSVYWAWPSPKRRSPSFWLPVDSDPAIDWFLQTRPQAEALFRRLPESVKRRLWRFLWRAGLLAPISATARKLGAPTRRDRAEPLPRTLASDPAGWGLHGGPRPPACLLLTGGGSTGNKLVALVFEIGDSDPQVALKLPRMTDAEGQLHREAVALRTIQAAGSTPGVPQLLSERAFAGRTVVAETVILGRPLSEMLERRTYPAIAGDVVSVLCELAGHADALPERTGIWRRFVEPALTALEPDERPVARSILDWVGDLPEVPEHRDCSPWNLLVQRDGTIALLDWESAEPVGVPGLDLIYFLTFATFFVDGTMGSGRELSSYEAMLDPATLTGRVFAESTDTYADWVGLERGTLEHLRLLCWLVHARAAQLRTDEASDELERLFLALARNELRRWPRAEEW